MSKQKVEPPENDTNGGGPLLGWIDAENHSDGSHLTDLQGSSHGFDFFFDKLKNTCLDREFAHAAVPGTEQAACVEDRRLEKDAHHPQSQKAWLHLHTSYLPWHHLPLSESLLVIRCYCVLSFKIKRLKWKHHTFVNIWSPPAGTVYVQVNWIMCEYSATAA